VFNVLLPTPQNTAKDDLPKRYQGNTSS
jgi:hypothetical protein